MNQKKNESGLPMGQLVDFWLIYIYCPFGKYLEFIIFLNFKIRL